ncbi:glycoside hydrolase 5 family protein [Streptomyces acidiscabies]|uniref:Cellulase family glycosylhydrolase n=1 Tax=Streptomyces acidiscabies TaxID=42234 RepID=A0AAP6B5W2_9ACTN|nr:cellulase family glycosylhydrolase [Streptomyces acidiscabies]MBZ3913080.1 cellulase family glycosylhydrolase [Streptomyces acidiscabies]MDX2958567.1 cellulase family glycosylhydrolase [Streptomyces acidiscabies]MDX3020927.1 cellulase family glycosylhydrolase [Streptomyces acidiscabies]MDX3790044.1 cellulase family glycosylhydrolase [Streptomyces acidiscabies]
MDPRPEENAISTPPPAPELRFGVNYTPRRGWFHAWHDFDAQNTREDLAQIAALGLDHVRVFHLWPLLQPNRTYIRPAAVDQLVRLVDLAAEVDLDVMVDGVQGHLSSFDFYPEWTRSWHHRNVFTDPEAIEAQANLLRTLGKALADRPNLIGLQLGNELNNLVEHNPVTATEVDHYLDTLLTASREGLGPAGLVTHSAYDAAWYGDDHPFTPEASARKGDLTTVHPWVFSGDCARRYGPRSTQVHHLAEYGTELAKAYATDPTRKVWVQETGAPEPHIPAPDAPLFARETLLNAASCTNLWGVTWWCSHDVDRSLADYPELEYTLGLFDSKGTPKPIAEAIEETITELRTLPLAPSPRETALVLDCTPSTRSTSGPGGAFFETWMNMRAEGARPAIVLAERAGDATYLATRGVTELITPG